MPPFQMIVAVNTLMPIAMTFSHDVTLPAQEIATNDKSHDHASWVGLGWAGLGWAGLGWAGLGWAGLGWAGLCGRLC